MRPTILLLIILILVNLSIKGQESYTENTLKLSAGNKSPVANLEEIGWLAGHWEGEAMGGKTEEIWTLPKGGAMLGVFRFIKNDKIGFYELMTIVQDKDTILLRLKHFNPDLKGWEEKDKTVDFRFVSKKEGIVYFDGMTFKREGDKSLIIYLALAGKDGKSSEEKFIFSRKGK